MQQKNLDSYRVEVFLLFGTFYSASGGSALIASWSAASVASYCSMAVWSASAATLLGSFDEQPEKVAIAVNAANKPGIQFFI